MNAETKAVTILDLDSMMNETLDAIPETPDFCNPPAGEYTLLCQEAKVDSYKSKEGESGKRLKILYSVVETKSTLNNEPPVPNGSLFSETFQATEMGIDFFRKRIKKIMNVEDTTGVTLGAMMDASKGVTFNARLSYKKTKGKVGTANEGKEFDNLQMAIVA
jgi:hypothetical protein